MPNTRPAWSSWISNDYRVTVVYQFRLISVFCQLAHNFRQAVLDPTPAFNRVSSVNAMSLMALGWPDYRTSVVVTWQFSRIDLDRVGLSV